MTVWIEDDGEGGVRVWLSDEERGNATRLEAVARLSEGLEVPMDVIDPPVLRLIKGGKQ